MTQLEILRVCFCPINLCNIIVKLERVQGSLSFDQLQVCSANLEAKREKKDVGVECWFSFTVKRFILRVGGGTLEVKS